MNPAENPAPGAPTTGSTAAPRAAQPRDATRFDVWKERLLDLTLRNRLLNFADSRKLSIPLDATELDLFEDALVRRSKLRLVASPPPPKDAAVTATDARGLDDATRKANRLAALEKGHALCRLEDDELGERALAMFRAARTELQETGASTLYLALGFVRWIDSAEPDKPRLAPILLVPVELVRTDGLRRYELRLRDDEPRLNETLFEKLRLHHQLAFPELATIPQDGAGVDVRGVLAGVRAALERVPNFAVVEQAHVAFFSFAKFLLWRDLDEHGDALMRSPAVRHLVSRDQGAAFARTDFVAPEDVDRVAPASRTHLVLDADSSQRAAVENARRGGTFVLQGPPGTGKSQTIANLIAECLAAGKRVLFVAEKRAALDVVAKRLRNAGLGDACLELHSTKAQKREVILELARVLELEQQRARSDAARGAARTDELATKLTAYADALHRATPLGASHYESVGRLQRLGAAPRVAQRFESVLATTAEQQRVRFAALEELRRTSTALPNAAAHPLAAIGVAEWTPLAAKTWETALRALLDRATVLETAGRDAVAALGGNEAISGSASEALAALLSLHGGGAPPKTAAVAARYDVEQVLRQLRDDAALLRALAADLATLGSRFQPKLLALDLEKLRSLHALYAQSFFVVRWFGLRSARAQLAACATGPLPSPTDTIAILDAAIRARDAARKLEEEQGFLAECLGAAARGPETAPAAADALLDAVPKWRAALAALVASAPNLNAAAVATLDRERARQLAAPLAAAAAAYLEALGAANRALAVDEAAAFGGDARAAALPLVRARAESWLAALPQMREWCPFVAAENGTRAAELGEIVAAHRRGEVAAADLATAFERAFLETWIEQSFEATPELRRFEGRAHERDIAEFRDADAACLTAASAVVAATVARTRPNPNEASSADDAEIAILRREAQKKMRHRAIRRVLEEIPNLAARLKPCFLMSPLSIAQYLPATAKPFDLVVFDEASQIPTHDAIGALGRGAQVIVVGDSKQLPPTTFFSVERTDDDEDEEGEGATLGAELESILDECVAGGLPALGLRWHYRSRDERLIAFSNHRYYEDKLQTFPAALARSNDRGVHLRRVDGAFDRGKSKTNRKEAEAIVAWVVDALRDPVRRARSIGIVTFNQPQQSLVEDLLDDARRAHPEIAPYFADDAPEAVLVKNLENVQGDERDVILFSIAYGPDATGQVRMNFGPLNRAGGERRLNVAITRAREQLLVFTSLRPEQIDLSRTQARGVAHLREFLAYAELGPEALGVAGKPSATAGGALFEDVVHRALVERGHAVDRWVGCSDYRLDLAVRDPRDPQRYLLGVECDGPSYAAARTARDRDRLRASVLRSLGWRIHRVWSTDWHHDPARELARLEDAIARALKETELPEAKGANDSIANAHGA